MVRPAHDCGTDLCGPPRPAAGPFSTLLSLAPFAATFAVVFLVAARRLFPRLSRAHDARRDGEGHFLPASAPAELRQAHARHAALSPGRRAAAAAFAATVALAAVLAELILAEVSDLVPRDVRAAALRLTVPALLVLLVVAVPFLEVQSLVAAAGWPFRAGGGGRTPRTAWVLQTLGFAAWLCAFWWVGRAVPVPAEAGAEVGAGYLRGLGPGRLSRACLERIGVIGISLMALLSGFASVSTPWHTFVGSRAYRRRPVTDADILRKQAGLDATVEALQAKRLRLQVLRGRLGEVGGAATSGVVGKMLGSLKTIGGGGGGGGEAGEMRALQLEISGLETMEASLASSLALLRSQKAAHARDGTALGTVLALPTQAFAAYCVYRVLATSLTSLRRLGSPSSASFASSDPISRLLGLLARHWDPQLDQLAWARNFSFLLSGAILAASAGSAVQTLQLFARWAPGLVHQARANLALATGQVAATYVISAALLLRTSLPGEASRSVGDALEGALEPAFADRWFEGWFLAASAATAAGIWVGGKMGVGAAGGWDEWDEYEEEELGQKRRS